MYIAMGLPKPEVTEALGLLPGTAANLVHKHDIGKSDDQMLPIGNHMEIYLFQCDQWQTSHAIPGTGNRKPTAPAYNNLLSVLGLTQALLQTGWHIVACPLQVRTHTQSVEWEKPHQHDMNFSSAKQGLKGARAMLLKVCVSMQCLAASPTSHSSLACRG